MRSRAQSALTYHVRKGWELTYRVRKARERTVTGFLKEYLNKGVKPQDYSATVVPASNGLLSFPLQSLTNGVPYYVRVSASSDRGFGPYLNSAEPVAPLRVPGAVPSVMVKGYDHTHLQVEYEEAASNGGDLQPQP